MQRHCQDTIIGIYIGWESLSCARDNRTTCMCSKACHHHKHSSWLCTASPPAKQNMMHAHVLLCQWWTYKALLDPHKQDFSRQGIGSGQWTAADKASWKATSDQYLKANKVVHSHMVGVDGKPHSMVDHDSLHACRQNLNLGPPALTVIAMPVVACIAILSISQACQVGFS